MIRLVLARDRMNISRRNSDELVRPVTDADLER